MGFHEIKMQAYEEAIKLSKEGKDPFNHLKIASRMELLHYQSQGLKKVSIFSTGCDACKKKNGKVYYIGKAIVGMPIPNKRCAFHLHPKNKKYCFCRCAYLPEVDKC